MNKYELALVVNARIDDEERAKVLEKVQGYVTRFGGTISKVDEWGKRRLAYEIQKMREGFYYFIQFESESDAPIEIERRLRIMDNVLRYLIVRRDEDVAIEPPVELEEEVEAEEVVEEAEAVEEVAEVVEETAEEAEVVEEQQEGEA
jgi:small subunit ribosomal protein S6